MKPAFNFNTLIGIITVACLSYLARKTVESSEKMVAMSVQLEFQRAAIQKVEAVCQDTHNTQLQMLPRLHALERTWTKP